MNITVTGNASRTPDIGRDTIAEQNSLALKILQVVSPTNALCGIFGNCLLAAVLIRNWKKQSICVYLLWLCMSDNLVLLGNLILLVPLYFPTISWEIFFSDAGCNLLSLLIQYPQLISNWTLVLLTCERLVVTWFPFKSRTYVSPNRAWMYIGIMSGSIMILYFHTFGGLKKATFGMVPAYPWSYCVGAISPITFYFRVVSPWIHSALTAWLPCFLLFLGNLLIIYKLQVRQDEDRLRANSSLQSKQQGSSKSGDGHSECQEQSFTDIQTENKDDGACSEKGTIEKTIPQHSSTRSNDTNRKMDRMHALRRIRVTRTVLVLSFAYLVLTLPWTISRLAITGRPNLVQAVVLTCMRMLTWFNNSINIVLYTLSNKQIRKQIREMFRCT